MGDQSLSQLEDLLKGLLQPNTEAVRRAGQVLNNVLKQSNSMPALLELAAKSNFPEIRQVAAVLMRKRIVGHWGKLSADTQENIKKTLLHSLVHDSSHPVRRAIGALIGIIARILVPSGQWKELLDFMLQCTQSPNADHREVAMNLFDLLTETIGDYLRPHFPVLQKIFMQGFQDQESRVKIATLKAAGSLVHWITDESEVELFNQLLPHIVQGIQFSIANGFDEEALHAFEMFDDLVEMPLSPVVSRIPELVNFVLQVGSNKELDINIRQRALTFIEWVITFKPKSITKNNLVVPILHTLFPMMAEPEDDISDIEEMSNHKFSSQLLGLLAAQIPPKHLFSHALEFINRYIHSQHHLERRAGTIGLAEIAEGCSVIMSEDQYLTPLLNLVYEAAKDQTIEVREAACVALGQFSKYLLPNIIDHYQTILPTIFQALNDPTEQVRTSSCYAIDTFCENLGQEILPYLEPLMAKLLELLRVGDRHVQEVALSAITSTAGAAEKAFIPYYNVIMPMLIQMMQITEEQNIPLRCGATECAGVIALSVGAEVVGPQVEDLMKLAIQGTVMDYNELREYTYGFFGHMAQALKTDFLRFIPIIVPIVLASCDSNDGITGTQEEEEEQFGEIEADEDGGPLNVHIRTAFLDEKSSACYALGMFAEHVGAQFEPYIARIMKSFEQLQSYFHEDVRQAVIVSMKQMLFSVNAAYPPAKQWVKGLPSSEQPLQASVRQFADIIMPKFLEIINSDDDKQTVGTACEVIADIAKKIGPVAIEPHLPMLTTVFIKLLQKKTNCQSEQEGVDEPEEDEEEDLELRLVECACDCLVDLSKAFGHLLTPYFEPFAAAILKYQGKTKTSEYRSLAIGTVAEMCNALEQAIVPFVDALVQPALKGMKDEDPEVRSNSAYLVGVLMQHSGINGMKYYGVALSSLAPLFNDSSLPNIIDNSCGAVARIIMTAPSNALPLKEILPVLINALPLRKDFQENPTVYRCLFHLISTGNEAVAPLLPSVISVFSRVLGAQGLQQDVQTEMIAVIQKLIQQFGSQMEQVISSLPSTEQENLRKHLIS